MFHLADLEGCTTAEVAERLGMSPVTARVHLFHARRALRAGILERWPELAEETTTMNCASARRLMLEADLAELTPQAESELGAHLVSCAACRGAAEEIRRLEGGLAAWLAAAAPAADDADAIARAGTTARRRARARRIGAALTLAAAALLAGLLVLPARRDVTGPLPTGRPAAARGFSVVAAPGHEVMVMQPADPNIVVVWYLPYRRSS